MAKKSTSDASSEDAPSSDEPKKSKKKGRRGLGAGTVARPCLLGAAILTVLSAIVPR